MITRTTVQPLLRAGVALGIGAVLWTGSWTARPSAQEVQAQFAAETARAERAMDRLQQALGARLMAAMKAGGPADAVTVCRDEAVAIAEGVAREYNLAIGRTSHRVRNPANAPRPWARPVVEASAGAKAAAERLRLVDLGDRVGVLRPIGTIEMCTRCHGDAKAVRQNIGGVLAKAYPQDRATGFAAGDLRGWMWAEVPKTAK